MPAKLKIHLPDDEGLHKEPVEWWYWTAQGESAKGDQYALMFVLFKGSVLGVKNIYFAHWFSTDVKQKKFKPHFKVFWKGADDSGLRNGAFVFSAGPSIGMRKNKDASYQIKTPDFDLRFKPIKPPLYVGGTGLVDLKTTSTYYYSLPRHEVSGNVVAGRRGIKFKGLGWMDHQWSPVTLFNQFAWTWFSFQLDNGADLMFFSFGRKPETVMGMISWPGGKQQTVHKLKMTALKTRWKSSLSGASYPLEWQIDIPSLNLHLTCGPKLLNQEMTHAHFRYWEGPLWVHGNMGDQILKGHGFLELNGVPAGKNIILIMLRAVKHKNPWSFLKKIFS